MTKNTSDDEDAVEAHVAAKARLPEVLTRSVVHATFHLERTYEASRARVWKALTDSIGDSLVVACDSPTEAFRLLPQNGASAR